MLIGRDNPFVVSIVCLLLFSPSLGLTEPLISKTVLTSSDTFSEVGTPKIDARVSELNSKVQKIEKKASEKILGLEERLNSYEKTF